MSTQYNEFPTNHTGQAQSAYIKMPIKVAKRVPWTSDELLCLAAKQL